RARDRKRRTAGNVRDIGRAGEHIRATAERHGLPFVDHLGRTAQREHDVLTVARVDLDRLTGTQRANRQTRVVPVGLTRTHHHLQPIPRGRPGRPEPFGHATPPWTRAAAWSTAAATSPSGGNNSARPTTSPRTDGRLSALPQEAYVASGAPVGSPPRSNVGRV